MLMSAQVVRDFFVGVRKVKVKIEIMPEVVTVRLNGDIDHHSAAPVRESIDAAIEANEPSLLILDFAGVDFMDSSGIGLVMGRYRALQKRHAEIHIINVSPYINKVMQLSGIGKLAKIEPAGGEDKKHEN